MFSPNNQTDRFTIDVVKNATIYRVTTSASEMADCTTLSGVIAFVMPALEQIDFTTTTVTVNNLPVNTLEKAHILLRSIR